MDVQERLQLSLSISKQCKGCFKLGEIDYFIYEMSQQKPHIKIQSHINNSKFELTQSTFIQRNEKSENNFMMLKCFNTLSKQDISMKVFFLENEDTPACLRKLEELAVRIKSLARTDLILKISEFYTIKGLNGDTFFFVAEMESIQMPLRVQFTLLEEENDLYFDQTIKPLIKDHLEYLQEALKTKTFVQNNDITKFNRQQILNNFYVTSENLKEFEIKVDSFAQFLNFSEEDKNELLEKTQELFKVQQTFNWGVQAYLPPPTKNGKQEYQRTSIKIEKYKRKSIVISRNELTEFIKTECSSVAHMHDPMLFTKLSSQQGYDQYEILEFDADAIIMSCMSQEVGKKVQFRIERFSTSEQALDAKEKLTNMLQASADIFLPIINTTILNLDSSSYIVLEEQRIPRQYHILQDEGLMHQTEQQSLHSFLFNAESLRNPNEKMRQRISILIKLIEKIENLHQSDQYHGSLSTNDILLQINSAQNNETIEIYLTNVLFERIRKEQETSKQNREKGKRRDYASMKFIMKEFAYDTKLIIGFGVEEQQKSHTLLSLLENLHNYYNLAANSEEAIIDSAFTHKLTKKGLKYIKSMIFVEQVVKEYELHQVTFDPRYLTIRFNNSPNQFVFGGFQNINGPQLQDYSQYFQVFSNNISRLHFQLLDTKLFKESFVPTLTLSEHIKSLAISCASENLHQNIDQLSFSLDFLKMFPNIKTLALNFRIQAETIKDFREILNLQKIRNIAILLEGDPYSYTRFDDFCSEKEGKLDKDLSSSADFFIDFRDIFQSQTNFQKVQFSTKNIRFVQDLIYQFKQKYSGLTSPFFSEELKREKKMKLNPPQKLELQNGLEKPTNSDFTIPANSGFTIPPTPPTLDQIIKSYQTEFNEAQKHSGFNFNFNNNGNNNNNNKNKVGGFNFGIPAPQENQQPFGGFGQIPNEFHFEGKIENKPQNSKILQQSTSLPTFSFNYTKQPQFNVGVNNNAPGPGEQLGGFGQFGYRVQPLVFGNLIDDQPVNQENLEKEENKEEIILEGVEKQQRNYEQLLESQDLLCITSEQQRCILSFLQNQEKNIDNLFFVQQIDNTLILNENCAVHFEFVKDQNLLLIEAKSKSHQPDSSTVTFECKFDVEGKLGIQVNHKYPLRISCVSTSSDFIFDTGNHFANEIHNLFMVDAEIHLFKILGANKLFACSHCDWVHSYLSLFETQQNLQYLHIDLQNVCEQIKLQMKEDPTFLSFTQPQFKHLRQLVLEFGNVPSNINFFRQLYRNLNKNKKINSLEIKIKNHDQFLVFKEYNGFSRISAPNMDLLNLKKVPRVVSLYLPPTIYDRNKLFSII